MSMELFKKLIDEISEKRPYAYIQLFGIGESTLDKTIITKIQYAINKGVKNINIATNGQLLMQNDMYKRLIDAGIMAISVDLDGFSQETYSKIRVGGVFQKTKEGILKLAEYANNQKSNVRIEIAYHVYPDINDNEVDEFINWCENEDMEYYLVPMHNWAGLRNDIPKSTSEYFDKVYQNTERRNPCSFLWSNFMIVWNGDVPICFQDANASCLLGSVNESSIEEIWKGTHRLKRKEQIDGEFSEICCNCDTSKNTCLPPFKSDLYSSL